jgi:D-alanyl-D-alanine carboxypeptidase (penicillin-binding protein 5/6)
VEEVWVAGQSPGRAEQQESSGEATGRKAADRETSEASDAAEAAEETETPEEAEETGAARQEEKAEAVADKAAEKASGGPSGKSSTVSEISSFEMSSVSGAGAGSGAGSGAGAEPESDSDSQPMPEPDSELESEPELPSVPESTSDTGTGRESASASQFKAESKSDGDRLGDGDVSSDERPGESGADPGEPAESEDAADPEGPADLGDAAAAKSSEPDALSDEPTREPGEEPGDDSGEKPEAGKEPEPRKEPEAGKEPEAPLASGAPTASAKGDPVAALMGSASTGTKAVEAPKKTPSSTGAGRQSTFVPLVPQDPDRAAERGKTAPPLDDALGPKRERTKQLPVPPVPGEPLKLLAELTNTPPPPATPLRIVWRRVKIWTPLVVLLVLVIGVVQALRPLPEPELKASGDPSYTFGGGRLAMPWPGQGQSVVEVEGLGGLGGEGAQTPEPIASVTKVMTAYVVLKDYPLSGNANGPLITIDPKAARESSSGDESTAKVKAGQKFTERQMLELLLIPSGNNIARMLARWDAGSEAAFVKKMTRATTELGMKNTTYTGPSGFESTTRSTAVDQLKLARQVMKNDVFRSVVATPNVNIPGVGMIYNNNNLLMNIGVLGVKTGSSTPAGGALMWAARRTVEGKKQMILGVVLQQHSGGTVYDSLQLALTNSMKLIKAVQDGLTSATVVKKGQVVGYLDDGLGGKTSLVATESLTAIGWAGLTRDLKLTPAASGIPHQAKAGTKVGTLSFGSGSALMKVPVALKSDLVEPSFGSKLTRLG